MTLHCVGCVAGGSAPDIMLYAGPYDIARKIPNRLAISAKWWLKLLKAKYIRPEYASFAKALRSITRTPITAAPAILNAVGQSMTDHLAPW